MERLQSRFGSAILLTTRHLEEAERLCDPVAIMNHGTIAAIGALRYLQDALAKNAAFEDVFEHFTSDMEAATVPRRVPPWCCFKVDS